MQLYVSKSWITDEFPDLRYFHPFTDFQKENDINFSEIILQTVHDSYIPRVKENQKKILYHFEPHYRTPYWWKDCDLVISTHTELDINGFKGKVLYYPFAFFYLNSHNYIPRLLSRPFQNIEFKHKKFCIFINSNQSAPERIDFCQRLMKYKHVDCAGGALNNCERIKEPYYSKEFLEKISEYKFMISFENSNTKGYFTEKPINAYLGNTIPIYWCNSEAQKYFNEKSMVLIPEYTESNIQKALQKIIELDTNDELYKMTLKESLFVDNEIPKEFKLYYIKEAIREVLD